MSNKEAERLKSALCPRGMGTWRAMSGSLLAIGLLAGCGNGGSESGGSPSADRERAAVRDRPFSGGDALLQGILHADPKTGCLWTTPSSGGSMQVLLLGDYRVRFTPSGAVVYRGDEVRAREGENVSLGGGIRSDPGVPGCPVSPSSDGSVWKGSL